VRAGSCCHYSSYPVHCHSKKSTHNLSQRTSTIHGGVTKATPAASSQQSSCSCLSCLTMIVLFESAQASSPICFNYSWLAYILEATICNTLSVTYGGTCVRQSDLIYNWGPSYFVHHHWCRTVQYSRLESYCTCGFRIDCISLSIEAPCLPQAGGPPKIQMQLM
jgi:hypothetical protein